MRNSYLVTNQPLGANQQYFQPSLDTLTLYSDGIHSISGFALTDQQGTLYLEVCDDNVNFEVEAMVNVYPNTPGFLSFMGVEGRYCRFRFDNGPTAQGSFQLHQTVDSSVLPGAYTDEQAIPVRSAGINDIITNSVTITGTPVELKVNATPLASRKQLLLYPPASGTVYWGNASVTSATGAPLKSTDNPITFDFVPTRYVPIYAVNDGTIHDVTVVEVQ